MSAPRTRPFTADAYRRFSTLDPFSGPGFGDRPVCGNPRYFLRVNASVNQRFCRLVAEAAVAEAAEYIRQDKPEEEEALIVAQCLIDVAGLSGWVAKLETPADLPDVFRIAQLTAGRHVELRGRLGSRYAVRRAAEVLLRAAAPVGYEDPDFQAQSIAHPVWEARRAVQVHTHHWCRPLPGTFEPSTTATRRRWGAALYRNLCGPAAWDLGFTRTLPVTEHVAGLVKAIISHRELGTLPVLADALEEAGCAHPGLLVHLREVRPDETDAGMDWVLSQVRAAVSYHESGRRTAVAEPEEPADG